MKRLPALAGLLLIPLSAWALWQIRAAWLSLYPMLGAPLPALPLPSVLALQLASPLPLCLLALAAGLAAGFSGVTGRQALLLLALIGWFACFLFLSWALALPFMQPEVAL